MTEIISTLAGREEGEGNPRAHRRARAITALAAVHFAIAASGQDWKFEFDSNGNLQTQTPASTALPQIRTPLRPQTPQPGALASFFVVAANTPDLTYQWRFNAENIVGATNDTLLLAGVSVTNEGQYSVVLSNNSGSVTSAPAALWLDGDRDGLADSWELANFSNLNQYPTGDSDGDGVSNFDEFLDGTNPADRASARFRLTVLSNGGSVSSLPLRSSYTNGEVVTLTATAFPLQPFRGWTGDADTTNELIDLTMTTNKTVFAHFGPYDIFWTNIAGGDWHVRSNWKPSFVPTSNDNVFISTNAIVTINGTTECGSLTFGNAGSTPTLTGSGTLTLHGVSTWERGTMSGSGRTIIPAGSTLNMPNAVTVNLTGRTLENGGTILWTGAGNINFNNAVITNRLGALFYAQTAGGDFNNSVSSIARFDNAGVFRRSYDSGVMTIFVALNNYNTVEFQTGSLSLRNGGANYGDFDMGDGTALSLDAGTFISSAGSSIAGAANFSVSGAIANLAGSVNLSGNHTFSAGTANLTGAYFCTNNTLTISGGTANFNGTGTVSPAVINLSGGTLGGVNLVTVLSQMDWTGGTMSGIGRTFIPVGSVLNLNPASSAFLTSRTLENGGTVLWTGIRNLTFNNAVVTNRAGALFHVEGSGVFNNSVSSIARFDNAGMFRKSIDPATFRALSGVSFNNYNAVEIQSGALQLEGGGINTGTFDMSAGTALNLAVGTFNATAGSSIVGRANLTVISGTANLAGLMNLSGNHTFSGGVANLTGNYICTNNTVTISGGTANFNDTGPVSPAVINLSIGTLGGANIVTVENQMNWSGGTMNGSGRTIISSGSVLNVTPANAVFLTTRTLENAGTVLWTGAGNIQFNNAVITNRPGALFDARSPGGDLVNAVSSVARFDNAGTFRKSVDVGTMIVALGLRFNNYSQVEIQTGILWAHDVYSSSSNVVLNCAIGGTTVGSGYGQLQLSGAVILNGALGVSFINGFLPATNDTFTVLTAGTRNGTFANFSYPSNAVTMQLSNTPNSVVVRVTGSGTVSGPTLLQPELSGSDFKLIWTAVSNTAYRLEFKSDLNSSNWIAVPGDVIGVSNTASKLDVLTPSNRFYRVRILP